MSANTSSRYLRRAARAAVGSPTRWQRAARAAVGSPTRWQRAARAAVVGGLSAVFLAGCAPALLLGGATAVKVAHDRRTAASQLEDQIIEIKTLKAIHQAGPQIGRTHINAASYNGIVLLSGEVEREETRRWIETVVGAIDGVRTVHNELRIAPPSGWGSWGNDAWLTTKAKSVAIKVDDIPGFDPTRIKVVTERGVVYLFGLVTPQEGDAVTEHVRRLSGVQQVVKLFEYI